MRLFKYLKLKKKVLFIFLSSLFSLVVISIGTYYIARMRQEAARSKATGGVSLYFDPQSPTVSVNSNFTLNVKINPGTEKVTAVELYLSFDKDRIEIENIESTPAFSTVLKNPLIDNNQGRVTVVVGIGVEPPPPVPVVSIADVVIIKAKTKNLAGNAVVRVDQDSKAAAIGKDSNVIGSYGEASVNITPTPLSFKIKFQGIAQQRPDKKVKVTFKNGQTFENINVTSDTSGVYSGVVNNINPGTYEVLIKGPVHLQKNFGSVTFVADQTVNKDWSGTILLAGDFNNDNKLNITDIAAILAKYIALSIPADETNRIYDIDSNYVINISDVALVLANYTALEVPGDN